MTRLQTVKPLTEPDLALKTVKNGWKRLKKAIFTHLIGLQANEYMREQLLIL